MDRQNNLNDITAKIQLIKKTAQELNQIGEDFPAIYCNTVRILASVKMLEINIPEPLKALLNAEVEY